MQDESDRIQLQEFVTASKLATKYSMRLDVTCDWLCLEAPDDRGKVKSVYRCEGVVQMLTYLQGWDKAMTWGVCRG